MDTSLPLHLRVCNITDRHVRMDKENADRSNAFTIRSYKKDPFFNVGKPLVTAPPLASTSYIVSDFRKKLLKNSLPFNIDYSSNRLSNLAWKEPIQSLNLSLLLPVLIEGFMDSEEYYRHVILLAIDQLMHHSSIHQMMAALPNTRRPFTNLFHSQRPSAIVSGLDAIRLIVDITRGMKETVTAVFREILIPLNRYYSNFDNVVDERVRSHQSDLLMTIDKTLRQLEVMGGNWRQQLHAFRDIKRTCAVYESAVFPPRLAHIDHQTNKRAIQTSVKIRPRPKRPGQREAFYPQIRLYDMNFV